jgi:hypothetical protein
VDASTVSIPVTAPGDSVQILSEIMECQQGGVPSDGNLVIPNAVYSVPINEPDNFPIVLNLSSTGNNTMQLAFKESDAPWLIPTNVEYALVPGLSTGVMFLLKMSAIPPIIDPETGVPNYEGIRVVNVTFFIDALRQKTQTFPITINVLGPSTVIPTETLVRISKRDIIWMIVTGLLFVIAIILSFRIRNYDS